MAVRISLLILCITLLICHLDASMVWASHNESVTTTGFTEPLADEVNAYQPESQKDEMTIHGTTNAKKKKSQNIAIRFGKWVLKRMVPMVVIFGALALYLRYRKDKEEQEHPPRNIPKKGALSPNEMDAFNKYRQDLVLNIVHLNQQFDSPDHNPAKVHTFIKEHTAEWSQQMMERGQEALKRLLADPTLTAGERAELEPLEKILATRVKPLLFYASPSLLEYVRKANKFVMDILEPKYNVDFSEYRQYLLTYDGTRMMKGLEKDYGADFMQYLNDNKEKIPEDEWKKGEYFALGVTYLDKFILDFNNTIVPHRVKVEKFLKAIEGNKDEALQFVRTQGANYETDL